MRAPETQMRPPPSALALLDARQVRTEPPPAPTRTATKNTAATWRPPRHQKGNSALEAIDGLRADVAKLAGEGANATPTSQRTLALDEGAS